MRNLKRNQLKNSITSNCNMKKIISQKIIDNLPNREIDIWIKEFLHADHGLSRELAIISIASKLRENYSKYSQMLLNEMNNEVHFMGVRLGNKSAWTLAIALIENLKTEDYIRIKQEFNRWGEEEKEGLLDWLKDFPDHRKILEKSRE